MPSKMDLLLEAEKRGILPDGHKALLGEARKRGIVPEGQDIINEVAKEHPGLKKALGGLTLINETPERKKGREEYGLADAGSETWLNGNEGDKTYLHPNKGKGNYIEFFKEQSRDEMKNSVLGESFHLLHNDPEYQKLWNKFKNNYTPEEAGKIAKRKGAFKDANSPGASENAKNDAYVRAFFNEPDVMKWQKESGNTMYSPKQLEILEQMKKHIDTEPENTGK